MKKIIKYSFSLSLILILIQCTPNTDGSYGETVNRSEQITGTWVIEKVTQIDLDAEKKSFPEFATVADITNAVAGMPFSDFTLKIGNGTLETTIGNSPMSYVLAEGTGTYSWVTNETIDLVNEELGINASSGINAQINGEDVTLLVRTFSGITGENPKLSLNYERLDDSNNPVTRYEYTLAKQ